MRVTVDTNVLISATFWKGDSFKIIEMAEKQEIELVLSQEILDEYEEILKRDEMLSKVVDKNLKRNEVVQKIERVIISSSLQFSTAG
ncbi:MAG: putative toxin-antitoxin system toxin component, PIN family [Nanoarchaeota archaeon]|nr:putative toxin-antitoxin system toxin component, PIN family [Nanoarchaeota archaeon]